MLRESKQSYNPLTMTSPEERISSKFVINRVFGFFFPRFLCIFHVCIRNDTHFISFHWSKRNRTIIIKRYPWSFLVNKPFCLHSAVTH